MLGAVDSNKKQKKNNFTMDVKRRNVTNRKQFDLLVSQMEAHPAVAKGLKFCEASRISKERVVEVWNELCNGLNSLGPPTRSVSEWQKVWTDFKLKIKRKLAHNKREADATGGGPNQTLTLSAIEEAVVNLLSLDRTVSYSGSVFGLSRLAPSPPGSPLLSSTLEREHQSSEEPMEDVQNQIRNENVENTANSSNTRNRKHARQIIEKKDRYGLLVEQTNYLKKIVEHSGECARYARKAFKLKQEQAKKREEYMLQKQRHRQEELEYKIQLLNYKKQKLALLELAEK